MRTGNLFVISGPSGAGKGTLVARLLEEVPDAWVSVSATTRRPRPGEVDGVHYFFLSDDEFDALIDADGLLEWAWVHEHRYGTPRKTVVDHLAAGNQVVLEIDVQGAFMVREKMPSCILVFIEPPSLDELRERLHRRGTESEDVIEKRMRVAEVELSREKEYDIRLVNDDIDRASRKLIAIVNEKADREKD